jgi:methionyl-tRNA formyltransferase
MNVVLAAEESAGLQMLRALAASPHHLVAVLTSPSGSGSFSTGVWNVARNMACQTWPAEMVKDPNLAECLRSHRVDILLNVYSLYRIHRAVLAAPQLGAFNLHPGPLPRYSGLNAVSWAIFRGEQTHGVTVHWMDAGIDTGPIAFQSFFPIAPDDTALSLSLRCVQEGTALMLRLLELAEKAPPTIPRLHQDPTQREYFGKGVPAEGWICWSWAAAQVVNFVRACDYLPFPSPWGQPRTFCGMKEIALVKANRTGLPCNESPGTVGTVSNDGALVASGDEWVLARKLRIDDRYVRANEVLKPGDILRDR